MYKFECYNYCIYRDILILILLGGGVFFVPTCTMERFTMNTSLFISVMLAVIVLFSMNNGNLYKNFGIAEIIICILTIYFSVRTNITLNFIRVEATILYIYIIVKCYYTDTYSYNNIYTMLALLSFVVSVYGILQLFYLVPSFNSMYSITGPFDNPAGIAMLLAVLFPYLFYNYNRSRNRGVRIMMILGMCMAVTCIVCSESRTGMVALLFTVLFIFYSKWKRYAKILVSALTVILFILMYMYKPLSANGRLFINYNCCNILSKHFWWGSGVYGFDSQYMPQQAEYFKNHSDSLWERVADNVSFPFNEFIGCAINWGIIGLLAILSLIAYAIFFSVKYKREDKCYALASLVAFFICACFSYPLNYPVMQVLFIVSLCILLSKPSTSRGKLSAKQRVFQKVITVLVAVGLLVLSVWQIHYELRWKRVADMVVYGDEESALPEYRELHGSFYFKHHPYFLYNYGFVLYELGLYQGSLSVLKDCELSLNNYDVQLLEASGYEKNGEYVKAMEKYMQAHYMIPCRLLPLFRIMKIYDRLNEKDKAYAVALEADRIQIKVSSYEVNYMKAEIKNYLLNFEIKEGGATHDIKEEFATKRDL